MENMFVPDQNVAICLVSPARISILTGTVIYRSTVKYDKTFLIPPPPIGMSFYTVQQNLDCFKSYLSQELSHLIFLDDLK